MPLLVGGTMLYYRALQRGLSELPPADPVLRAEIEAQAKQLGWPALHAQLAGLDAATAARLHPNDSQRIQRALEIMRITGEPASRLQRGPRDAGPPGPVLKFALWPPDRAALHAAIERRFHEMMEAGFLAEVARLRARGDLHELLPCRRAVGYRQLWAHLDGEGDLATAVQRGIAATRQLAKRQFTWLRSEPDVEWLEPQSPGLPQRVLERIRQATVQISHAKLRSPPAPAG
jgi:tRNA dimethylallyltransferase